MLPRSCFPKETEVRRKKKKKKNPENLTTVSQTRIVSPCPPLSLEKTIHGSDPWLGPFLKHPRKPGQCQPEEGEAAFGPEKGIYLSRCGSSDGNPSVGPDPPAEAPCHSLTWLCSPRTEAGRGGGGGGNRFGLFPARLPAPVLENWKEAHQSKGPWSVLGWVYKVCETPQSISGIYAYEVFFIKRILKGGT